MAVASKAFPAKARCPLNLQILGITIFGAAATTDLEKGCVQVFASMCINKGRHLIGA